MITVALYQGYTVLGVISGDTVEFDQAQNDHAVPSLEENHTLAWFTPLNLLRDKSRMATWSLVKICPNRDRDGFHWAELKFSLAFAIPKPMIEAFKINPFDEATVSACIDYWLECGKPGRAARLAKEFRYVQQWQPYEVSFSQGI